MNTLARGLAIAGTLWVFGCTEVAPRFIALPGLPETVGFLLVFDQLDAAPTSVSAAFYVGSDATVPASVSVEDHQTLLLVTVDRERIALTGARLRSAPAEEHELELSEETCSFGRLQRVEDETRLRVAVSASGVAHAAFTDSSRFEALSIRDVTGLSLASFSLPVEPGGCRLLPEEAVRPFDPEREFLLGDETLIRGAPARHQGVLRSSLQFVDILGVSPDRIVASSLSELLVFDKGRAFTDASSHRLSPAEVPGLSADRPGEVERWIWRTLVLLPASGSRPDRLLAGLNAQLEVGDARTGFRSALVEIELGEAGFGRVRTATVWEGDLVAVETEPTGSVHAVYNESVPQRGAARDAFVLSGDSSDGPWRAHLISPGVQAQAMVHTPDPQRPHLIGFSLGRLMLGNLSREPPSLETLATNLTGDMDALAAAFVEDELTVWLGNDRGSVSVFAPGAQNAVPLLFRLPIEASSCGPGLDACGWSGGTNRALSMEYIEEVGGLAMTFQSCEASIVLRLGDLCPSSLAFPGEETIENSRAGRRFRRTPRGLLFYESTSRVAEIEPR